MKQRINKTRFASRHLTFLRRFSRLSHAERIRRFIRMKPTRIVIAEVSGPSGLAQMNIGHPGSIATNTAV